jgi:hypothetical protein
MGVEVLNDHDAVLMEQAITFVFLGCPTRRVELIAVHFQNAPPAVQANQEVRFSIAPPRWRPKARRRSARRQVSARTAALSPHGWVRLGPGLVIDAQRMVLAFIQQK